MKRKTLALSIVIPVYNEEVYIDRCLQAIARQTMPPDEVILVDNNSTDKTLEVASKYPFVKVVHEPKQGIVHARNTGFNAAKSGLIGRIDSDTVLPPNWVAYAKEFYRDPAHATHALTGGGYYYNLRFPGPRLSGWLLGQIAYRMNRLLMGHYIVWGSNMVIPATLWRSVRNLTCKRTDIHEDLDLAIHLHKKKFQITYKENLRVGVAVRRVFSDHHTLYENMMFWPRTLKAHGLITWVFGWAGAILLYAGSLVLIEKPAKQ